ncbi:hypothetical protein [Methylobacter sp. YRD-M1]|uniref:hypothetical protein n=1 Tax=Methylobacter sp. YRD-M1 TaxID=2911520 RepID=UPI00227BC41C|nr:hypothetical protein [Methylobacter sp. YRD-M1]WAK00374.1 hypothetical protein LZ558_10940 [Methylobacter sp. YRD-M1]
MNRSLRVINSVGIGVVILLLTVAVSLATETPVRSLVPYGVAVALATWRQGMGAGFLFAGLATLVALAAGAFPTRIEWIGQAVEEGLFTYLKLSAIAAGIALGKRLSAYRR